MGIVEMLLLLLSLNATPTGNAIFYSSASMSFEVVNYKVEDHQIRYLHFRSRQCRN